MTVVIVSADHFGKALRAARRKNNIPKSRFKALFECNEEQYHRYEFGIDLMPHNALERIFAAAADTDKNMNNK